MRAPWLVAAAVVVTAAIAGAATEPPHVPGELIVRTRAELDTPTSAAMFARHRLRLLRAVPSLRIALVAVEPGRTLTDVARELTADPEVEFVHPNYLGQGGFLPNDTYFDDQWHHHNTMVPGSDIASIDAWEITRGDPAVVLAVLDTGIQHDHPDFVGRILPGYDFINDDADPEADHAHGVECAGLAAANADNAFGVAGVDHFTGILPVKVLDELNRGTTMALIEGLDYAGPLADVLSLSLINYPDSGGIDAALQGARDAGAIVIACAGNGGIGDADVSMPGKSPLTISVGATAINDQRAPFSGTGAALDVVAPGANVITARYGTIADEAQSFSGCSAATPVVAGIASLARALRPGLSHDQMRQALIDGAWDQVGLPAEDTPGRDDYMGWGRVDAFRTLCIVFGDPIGSLGNRLLARRSAADVVLEWPLGFVSNDFYNVHRAASVVELDKTAYTAPLWNTQAIGVGTFTDPGAVPSPPDLVFYEVYGRECTGTSIIQ